MLFLREIKLKRGRMIVENLSKNVTAFRRKTCSLLERELTGR